MTLSTYVGVRLDIETHKLMILAARRKGLGVSSYIRMVLMEHLKELKGCTS